MRQIRRITSVVRHAGRRILGRNCPFRVVLDRSEDSIAANLGWLVEQTNRLFGFEDSAKALASIGHAIRAARVARDITAADLAARARVSRSTITRVERGDPGVAMGSWVMVLEQLGLLYAFRDALNPERDAQGEFVRAARARQRARPGGKTVKIAESDYDF